MSCFDEVPVMDPTWNPDGSDERDFMEDVFKSITQFDFERRHFHNGDGWFAEEAFSEKCLALGHAEDADGDDPHYADGDHTYGWNDSMICTDTKWGVACTECESDDCPYLESMTSIWSMKGVAA